MQDGNKQQVGAGRDGGSRKKQAGSKYLEYVFADGDDGTVD